MILGTLILYIKYIKSIRLISVEFKEKTVSKLTFRDVNEYAGRLRVGCSACVVTRVGNLRLLNH